MASGMQAEGRQAVARRTYPLLSDSFLQSGLCSFPEASLSVRLHSIDPERQPEDLNMPSAKAFSFREEYVAENVKKTRNDSNKQVKRLSL